MKSIIRSMLTAVLVLLSLTILPAQSRELAGVSIEEQLSLPEAGTLVLNGAGIRYKFFFKIYVGALYLPQKQSDAVKVLAANSPSRIVMHIVYDEVPRQKLVNAWNEGFENNSSQQVLQQIQPRIDEFNSWFGDLRQGDVVLLDYLPGQGTRVSIKGEVKGVIPGEDFNRALLSVWLGEEPVTEELKDAMLGLEES